MNKLLKFFIILLVAPAALIIISACTNENTAIIITKDGVEHKFKIEIADNDKSRAKGLMFRQKLAPNEGMLFDFFEEKQVSFWMRDTFIPLDMLFIDAQGIIKKIHINAKPHDLTSIPSDVPVRFVLEINGSRSVELGIKVGDKLLHPRVENKK